MKNYLIIDAVSYLDADILAKHLEKKEALRSRSVKQRNIRALRWSTVAAVFCLVLTVGFAAAFNFLKFNDNDPGKLPSESVSSTDQGDRDLSGTAPSEETGDADQIGPGTDSTYNGETAEPETSGSTAPEKPDGPVPGVPGVTVAFGSLSDISDFISAAESEEEQFYKYTDAHGISGSVTHDDARHFADHCRKLICNKSDVACDSFSGAYDFGRNELSLIYNIGGVTYRFIYHFDVDIAYDVEGEPVLRDVKVGPFKVDLYQEDGCLWGFINNGNAAIEVIVKAEEISDIDFGVFTNLTYNSETWESETSGSTAPDEKPEDPVTGSPDVTVAFDSLSDISEFISAAESEEEQFYKYTDAHGISGSVTHNDAKRFADRCKHTKLLCNKSGVACDSFSGAYDIGRNELSLIYNIGGVTYSFIYHFDVSIAYGGDEPVLRDVKVGPFECFMYQGDGRLFGFINDGDAAIEIVVKAEEIGDIDFEAFTVAE